MPPVDQADASIGQLATAVPSVAPANEGIEDDSQKPVLVLGMFYASAAQAEREGPGSCAFRDRARLTALEGMNYLPYTISNYTQHTPDKAEGERHLNGDFNNSRIIIDITDSDAFRDVCFQGIFLDYFRFPGDYAVQCYKPTLFSSVIPSLYEIGLLHKDAPVFVMNNKFLTPSISGATKRYYRKATPAKHYPLWQATEAAIRNNSLPAQYTNATECRELRKHMEFYRLGHKPKPEPRKRKAANSQTLPPGDAVVAAQHVVPAAE